MRLCQSEILSQLARVSHKFIDVNNMSKPITTYTFLGRTPTLAPGYKQAHIFCTASENAAPAQDEHRRSGIHQLIYPPPCKRLCALELTYAFGFASNSFCLSPEPDRALEVGPTWSSFRDAVERSWVKSVRLCSHIGTVLTRYTDLEEFQMYKMSLLSRGPRICAVIYPCQCQCG